MPAPIKGYQYTQIGLIHKPQLLPGKQVHDCRYESPCNLQTMMPGCYMGFCIMSLLVRTVSVKTKFISFINQIIPAR